MIVSKGKSSSYIENKILNQKYKLSFYARDFQVRNKMCSLLSLTSIECFKAC